MSKHKRFHGIHNTRQQAKAYAFMHRSYPYGSVRGVQLKKTAASLEEQAGKSQALAIMEKKTAPGVTSTESGKVEKVLASSDSTSNDTRETEDKQA